MTLFWYWNIQQEFKVITTSTEPKTLNFIYQKQEEKCQTKYFVGFCKFKDNCSKEHAKGDCEDIHCKNSKCTKCHRRLCRYENKCSHFHRKVCEFKHNSENISSPEKHLQKVQVEAELNLDECGKLRSEIKYLQ